MEGSSIVSSWLKFSLGLSLRNTVWVRSLITLTKAAAL